ncbi:proton-coupled folate transporter-like [Penaeus monodon]|uniref:proton-coupled folate transporter-like n=1 Tax=Penaeus monodon TaxID=6687 RepID=UPI0018A7297E|nr:proton-coupled folate transporter-like [Penaeus monodon]
MTAWIGSAVLGALKSVSVEPVMLVDGACNQAMLLFIENVQMNKICSIKLGLPDQVCNNLSEHPEKDVLVQREFSVFAFYNSIIMSIIPLIFVLFMGAWSDKYGRKIPLLMTLIGHVMYAGGYLLSNWQTSWPVEVIYLVTVLEALGGGNVGLLCTTISYISDICPEKTRTSRVSTANSLWYLGGPVGTLLGALVIKYGGYNLALLLVLLAYLSAVLYVAFVIKESHGPFAKTNLQDNESAKQEASLDSKDVSKLRMASDFFNWRRVVESFKTAFRQREGNARMFIMAIILSNMLRRVARGFFMYMFVRRALSWEATDYGYWITYRNLLAAIGSLFLVPILTKMLSFTDASLAVLGSLSIMGEYVCYSLVNGVSQAFLMWLGPPVGVISNASVIAFRSLSTKLVSKEEKGRISAVMAAMNGLMPMVAYAAYSPIYYMTVDTLPAAQFFFGASLNVLIMIIFIVIQLMSVSSSYETKDLESGDKKDKNLFKDFRNKSTVTLKSIARTLSGPVGETPSQEATQNDKYKVQSVERQNTVATAVERTTTDEGKGIDVSMAHEITLGHEKWNGMPQYGAVIPSDFPFDESDKKSSPNGGESDCEARDHCSCRVAREEASCYSNKMSDTQITASETP